MSDNTQAIEWYLARDGQQHGPVSEAELKKIIELGYLKPTDLVWRQGWADWQPASIILPPPEAAKPASPARPVPQPAPAPSAPKAAEPGRRSPEPAPEPTPHVRLEPEPAPAPAPARVARSAVTARWPEARVEAERAPLPSRPGSQREMLGDEQTVPRYQPMPGEAPGPERPGRGPMHPGAMQPGPMFPAPMGPGQGPIAHTGHPGTQPALHSHPAGPGPGHGHGPQHAPAAAPAPRRPAASADHEAERSGFPWRTAAVLVILAGLGGGAFALYKSGQLNALPFLGVPAGEGAVPVVSAPTTPSREAAGKSGSPAPAAANAAPIDTRLQRSPLWQILKRDFPDWYKERLGEAQRLAAESRDEREIAAAMTRALVELRRRHNAEALAASPPRLRAIAAAFVDNLGRLARHSTAACYGFISQGETSPAVTSIGAPEYRAALDAQLQAIFEAVAEGRKSPTRHEQPRKEDYDALTAELGKRGWSAADLQLFSDARALARAAPEKVCQMVNDWFAAQLAVKDDAARARLLAEALKPVVAG
jgi:hypothetical protein